MPSTDTLKLDDPAAAPKAPPSTRWRPPPPKSSAAPTANAPAVPTAAPAQTPAKKSWAPPPTAKPVVTPQPQEQPAIVPQPSQWTPSIAGIKEVFARDYVNLKNQAYESIADIIETSSQLVPSFTHPGRPDAGKFLAEKVRSYQQPIAKSSSVWMAANDVAWQAIGGLPVGVVEYGMGTPFAALHGIKTARQEAERQGREPTYWEYVRDAAVEAGGRWWFGKLLAQPMGGFKRGLAAGSVSAVQELGEGKDPRDAAVGGMVNFFLMSIGPKVSPGLNARMAEAQRQIDIGNTDGAMKIMDETVIPHLPNIEAAAETGATPHDTIFSHAVKVGDNTVTGPSHEEAIKRSRGGGEQEPPPSAPVPTAPPPQPGQGGASIRPMTPEEMSGHEDTPLEQVKGDYPGPEIASEKLGLTKPDWSKRSNSSRGSYEDRVQSLWHKAAGKRFDDHYDGLWQQTEQYFNPDAYSKSAPHPGESPEAAAAAAGQIKGNYPGEEAAAKKLGLTKPDWSRYPPSVVEETRGAYEDRLEELWFNAQRDQGSRFDDHYEAIWREAEAYHNPSADVRDMEAHYPGASEEEKRAITTKREEPHIQELMTRFKMDRDTAEKKLQEPRVRDMMGLPKLKEPPTAKPEPPVPSSEKLHKEPAPPGPKAFDTEPGPPVSLPKVDPEKHKGAFRAAMDEAEQEKPIKGYITGSGRFVTEEEAKDMGKGPPKPPRKPPKIFPRKYGPGGRNIPDMSEQRKQIQADLAVTVAKMDSLNQENHARLYHFANDLFATVDDGARLEWIDAAQHGELNRIPPRYREYFEWRKGLMDTQLRRERRAGLDVGEVEHYVQQIYDEGKEAPQRTINIGGRTIVPQPGFTKGKVFPTYAEAIAHGKVPKHTNPAMIDLHRIASGNKAIAEKQAVRMLETDGFAKLSEEIEEGTEPPDGWKETSVLGKNYFLNPEAQKYFKRAYHVGDDMSLFDQNTAAGNMGNKAFAAWMGIRNMTIPLRLGFSGFHADHVMKIKMAQPIAAIMNQRLSEHMTPGEFIKQVSEGASTDLQEFPYAVKAKEAFSKDPFNELAEGMSDTDRLNHFLFLAGGFTPVHETMNEYQWRGSFREMWHHDFPVAVNEFLQAGGPGERVSKAFGVSKEALKDSAKTIGYVMDKLHGPMFKSWIPRMKEYAYLDEAKRFTIAHPELLDGSSEGNAVIRAQLNQIRRNIDDRFGMMQFSKEFWHPMVKSITFANLFAVGWNYGFGRQFAFGPAKDAGLAALRKAHGNKAESVYQAALRETSSRIPYALAYSGLILMTQGALSFLMTGQPPGPNDMMYVKKPDGTHLTGTSFMRDWGSLYHRMAMDGAIVGARNFVVAKMNPMEASFAQIFNNQDYFGNEIADPNASTAEQWGKYFIPYLIAEQFTPFTFEAAKKAPGVVPEDTINTIIASAGGWNPAPAYAEQSTFIQQLHMEDRRRFGTHPLTFDREPRSEEKRDLKTLYTMSHTDKDPKKAELAKDAYEQRRKEFIKKYPEYSGRYLRRDIKGWAAPEGAMILKMLPDEEQSRLLQYLDKSEWTKYRPYVRSKTRHMIMEQTR